MAREETHFFPDVLYGICLPFFFSKMVQHASLAYTREKINLFTTTRMANFALRSYRNFANFRCETMQNFAGLALV